MPSLADGCPPSLPPPPPTHRLGQHEQMQDALTDELVEMAAALKQSTLGVQVGKALRVLGLEGRGGSRENWGVALALALR